MMRAQHRRAGEKMTLDDIVNELFELYERLSPTGELYGTEEETLLEARAMALRYKRALSKLNLVYEELSEMGTPEACALMAETGNMDESRVKSEIRYIMEGGQRMCEAYQSDDDR